MAAYDRDQRSSSSGAAGRARDWRRRRRRAAGRRATARLRRGRARGLQSLLPHPAASAIGGRGSRRGAAPTARRAPLCMSAPPQERAKGAPLGRPSVGWRWRWDLNPRRVSPHTLSRRAPSAARTRHRREMYRGGGPVENRGTAGIGQVSDLRVSARRGGSRRSRRAGCCTRRRARQRRPPGGG